jgi:hypothetical protein
MLWNHDTERAYTCPNSRRLRMLGMAKQVEMDDMASHMATLMNLKMLPVKGSIADDYDEAVKRNPFILGWAFGLGLFASKINGWTGSDAGFMHMKISSALFGSEKYTDDQIQLARIDDPIFLGAVNAAKKEYQPIYQSILQGDVSGNPNYFPTLSEYVVKLAAREVAYSGQVDQ